ncbi:hypothetical protein CC80DRAFT_599495 [Byssothecium circinans]|uniref:Uncharacterized protein n=1 Tax=Byssothecium circinans TaxID=147558 RepID=A0A6A5TAC7_9PLEO|nr:hypothetical protein CC80DRAFT_599495 [Byssothecium circinans]
MRPLSLLVLPLLTTLSLASPDSSPTKEDSPVKNTLAHYYNSPNEAFQDLLNALPEESLHAALVSSLSHFREGIFESDRHGVEHIHQDNPPLATKLIVAAVQDLKQKNKRQAPNNGTSRAAEPSPTQSQSQNPPNSTPAVLVPVQITTTDPQGRPTTTSQSVLSAATASVAVAVTTTNAAGQTTVSTTTKPAVVISTTDAAGAPVVRTSAVDYAPSAGQVLTTTDAAGSAFVTTYTPSGGRVSSIVLQTTTGADGRPTVVTSFAYVDPSQTTGQPPDKTSTAKPGLQSNAAVRGRGMGVVVGGAWVAGLGLWGLV